MPLRQRRQSSNGPPVSAASAQRRSAAGASNEEATGSRTGAWPEAWRGSSAISHLHAWPSRDGKLCRSLLVADAALLRGAATTAGRGRRAGGIRRRAAVVSPVLRGAFEEETGACDSTNAWIPAY